MPPRRRHRGGSSAAAPIGVRGPGATGGSGGTGGAGRRSVTAREHRPRLVIDGRNVQRALERGSAPGTLPTSSLIARLVAAFPDGDLELVLDGHAHGSPTGRVAPHLSVVYSRHATADEIIGVRVGEALLALGPAGAWSVTVVSDDREVRDHALRNGARVEGTGWLADRLAAPRRRGTGIGHGRPPRPTGGPTRARGRSSPDGRVD